MNIGLLLTRNAQFRPNHPAVVFEQHRLTFQDFNRRVNRLANALLKLGVRKGEKVVALLPNCLELLEIYWAVAKIGVVVVPLSPLLQEARALLNLMLDCEATTVITTSAFAGVLDSIRPQLPAVPEERYILTEARAGYQGYDTLTSSTSECEPQGVEIASDDTYNIIYSSGTTGAPKGIVHTHLIRAMYATLFASAFRMRPESVVTHAGSIIFNGAFVTLMPAMYLGATYVLQSHFEPSTFMETVERERVTHVMMVPSQITALLHEPRSSFETLRSLEMIGSVGAPLHREHKQELNRRLPGRFYELYGLTEGFVTILDKNDYAAKPNSVGTPPPFFEMRIIRADGENAAVGEVGEIVGRGPILMPGYYRQPELTAEAIIDGWLHTGDLGYVDANGFLFLVDRKKDMMVSGGTNVFPRDIEEVVVQHPAVREAAVFGVPSDKWGETPLAAVILRQAGSTTAEELRDWVNARVAAKNQRVHAVVIMESFPRNSAGKTLKRVLREPYWAAQAGRI